MDIIRILRNPNAVYHFDGERVTRTLNGKYTHHFKLGSGPDPALMMSDCRSAEVTEWLCWGKATRIVWGKLLHKAGIPFKIDILKSEI